MALDLPSIPISRDTPDRPGRSIPGTFSYTSMIAEVIGYDGYGVPSTGLIY